MSQSIESADQLRAYQARMMEVSQLLVHAFSRLNRAPELQMNRLHPNRYTAREKIEQMLVECGFLARYEAQHIYFDDDDATSAERQKAEQ